MTPPVKRFIRTVLAAFIILPWIVVTGTSGAVQTERRATSPLRPEDTVQTEEAAEQEPTLPPPPPPLIIDVTGDTIYTRTGRTIAHVIILERTPLEITYEGFFDHPRLARTYSRTMSMSEVARVEKSSDDEREQLRDAWARQIDLAHMYDEDVKRSGFVMFRGEWVTKEQVASVRRAEQELQARWLEARTSELRAAEREALASVNEQRRWIAASLQLGQSTDVLGLLGSPTSQREIPLATGIVQSDASWDDLGLRVIAQDGVIAFIERYQPRTISIEPSGQPVSETEPYSSLPVQ